MIALLDGDILTYRIGFTTQQDEEWIVSARLNDLIDSILEDCNVTEYKVFLTSTDKSNYRYQIYPKYKANRKQEKPIHYQYIRDYLVSQWNAEIVYGEEADDALGYNQTENTFICSIDKDLLMVPGKHYNFVKKEFYTISKQEGIYNFYWQILNGDMGDNIPGCPGIGPKAIEKLIHPDMPEYELFNCVFHTYQIRYEKKNLPNFEEDILRNGRLLKIKQNKEEPLWEFPNAMD